MSSRPRSAWPRAAGATRRAGFTLIELIAVVVIFVLVGAITLPNLGLRAAASARDEAMELAAALEFARQRAVVTGRRHQVMLDLDQQAWWVEAEEPAEDEPPAAPVPGELPRWSDLEEIPLSAPQSAELQFIPLPGALGRATPVRSQVEIEAVETAAGAADRGRIAVRFAEDGAAEATTVLLLDEGGGQLDVEVAPLLDTVRIGHGEG